MKEVNIIQLCTSVSVNIRFYGPDLAIFTKAAGCIRKRLRSNARAWQYFESLAPSYRKAFVGWIDAAKRDETKERRIREAIRLLAAGRKLGLK